jgi:hypothetical protein
MFRHDVTQAREITDALFFYFADKYGKKDIDRLVDGRGTWRYRFLGDLEAPGESWQGYAIATHTWENSQTRGYQFLLVKASSEAEVHAYIKSSTFYCRVLVNLNKHGSDQYEFKFGTDALCLLDPSGPLMGEILDETRKMLKQLGLTWEHEPIKKAA